MGLLTRKQVADRIAAGELLVVHRGEVLKLNAWLARHPGGDKAILHMVGRDATDEVDVYHSDATLARMHAFSVGRVELPWTNMVPPIQQGGDFGAAAASPAAPPPHARPENEKPPGDLAAEKETGTGEPEPASAARDDGAAGAAGQSGAGGVSDAEKSIRSNLERERARDAAKYPSVDPETQQRIQREFRSLHAELVREGLFECNYAAYAREALRICALLAGAALFYAFRGASLLRLLASALLLGLAWHQLVFIAHDAGHLAITHNYYADNLIGAFLASFVGGLSLGWWKRNHNVHHLVTNDPVHDPDIQHLPFFAVTSRLFRSVWSSYYEKFLPYDAIARLMLPVQHHMYYPLLCFGRFNLYRLSWEYVLLGLGPREGQAKYLRHFELVGLAAFAYWFFYLVVARGLDTAAQRLVFVLCSHVVTMPVHVQITLSHFAQSTSDLGAGESFAQRQVRTTMDVACPEWLDFVHGGLQFQAIHHLFPRMPRHNLRAAQPKVVALCQRLGLHYEIYGFTAGNRQVIDRLHDVAQQAAVFNECNDFCRREMVRA